MAWALSGAVLIGDSLLEPIGRFNTKTGKFDKNEFHYHEILAPPNSRLGIGVASVKRRGSYLSFNNGELASIYHVRITQQGYAMPGNRPELVTNVPSLTSGIEDFLFDNQANICLATNDPGNAILYTNVQTGRSKVVAGLDGEDIVDDSSLALGRNSNDSHILYISRGRSLNDSTTGASVVTLDTSFWIFIRLRLSYLSLFIDLTRAEVKDVRNQLLYIKRFAPYSNYMKFLVISAKHSSLPIVPMIFASFDSKMRILPRYFARNLIFQCECLEMRTNAG